MGGRLCPVPTRLPTRWFRRQWDESSDRFDSWGGVTYYYEVMDGWTTRQVVVYDNGPILRYGPGHRADDYGQKEWRRMDEREDWTPWAITAREFEEAWSRNL
jgi:hypothetical protein